MSDEEQAKEIRAKLAAALLAINGIIETSYRKGFDTSYTSNLINGKFETKINVAKRL